jgi:ferritin-like metal-binding protein YciE
MAEKDLNDLFLDTVKDIYYAAKQILKALPKMAKARLGLNVEAVKPTPGRPPGWK